MTQNPNIIWGCLTLGLAATPGEGNPGPGDSWRWGRGRPSSESPPPPSATWHGPSPPQTGTGTSNCHGHDMLHTQKSSLKSFLLFPTYLISMNIKTLGALSFCCNIWSARLILTINMPQQPQTWNKEHISSVKGIIFNNLSIQNLAVECGLLNAV